MASCYLLLSLTILTLSTISSAHNITQLLESDPNLSEFNTYLTRTNLDNEINSRHTITILAFPNSAISPLSNLSIHSVKKLLSLHVILDFYDDKKLHTIQNNTVLTNTLFQAPSNATSYLGEVNISDSKDGTVKFGSAKLGSKLESIYVKQIKQIPFSLSVLEITAPILVPELMSSFDYVNITDVLEMAGCKIFAEFLMSSGGLKSYKTHIESGITIFGAKDEAFQARGVPKLDKLSTADLMLLLQYHALNSYAPMEMLMATNSSLQTLAPGKYGLNVSTVGDTITLHTSVGSSRITATFVDTTPIVIYGIDNVLLPIGLKEKSSGLKNGGGELKVVVLVFVVICYLL